MSILDLASFIQAKFSIPSNMYPMIIAGTIILSFLIFAICARYYKKKFSSKTNEEQLAGDATSDYLAQPESLSERVTNDLTAEGENPKDKNEHISRKNRRRVGKDTEEFKERIFITENRFKNNVDKIVKRSLSGRFPIKYLRNFKMENEYCDFVVHWYDKTTEKWKCVFLNCQFSPSIKEFHLVKSLDQAVERMDKCSSNFEKYITSTLEMKVIVVNFPIPESYEPFYERNDIMFINQKSIHSFLYHLTSEIFDAQSLSKGLPINYLM